MLSLTRHSFPISQTDGYSTHLRILLHLDKYPTEYDVRSYISTADAWHKGCAEGKYLGREIKIISYRPFFKFYKKILQIDFDIAYAPEEVADCLLCDLENIKARPGSCRIVSCEIGFYDMGA